MRITGRLVNDTAVQGEKVIIELSAVDLEKIKAGDEVWYSGKIIASYPCKTTIDIVKNVSVEFMDCIAHFPKRPLPLPFQNNCALCGKFLCMCRAQYQPNPPEPSRQDKDGNPVWEKTKLPEKFKSNDIAPGLDQVISILNALIDVVREMRGEDKMTQQEIEEAIKQTEELIAGFDLSGDDRNPLNKLINLAKLHLSVMKSGMPKKKLTYQNRSIKIGGQEIKETDSRYNAGYNDGIKDFTAFLAQKLSGLEGMIEKLLREKVNPLACNGNYDKECSLQDCNNSYFWEDIVKDFATAIRKHLEVER